MPVTFYELGTKFGGEKIFIFTNKSTHATMRINLIQGKPTLPLKDAPALLFIHGAWHGAWCWEENFLPYFSAKGFECYAFDLPLHGAEQKPTGINELRISDYVRRLKKVVAQIGKPVILIGHSMGGYTVQNYLVHHDCAGAVLMTSVPGIPAWRLFRTLVKRDAIAMLKTVLQFDLSQLIATKDKIHQALFSKDFAKEKVEKYAEKLGPESFKVMLFDFLAKTIPQRKNLDYPLLVQCAENDELVTIEENKYTARWQKGEFQFFKEIAHDVMLEEKWQVVADGILKWINKHFPQSTPEKVDKQKNRTINEVFPDAIQDLIITLGEKKEINASKTKILGLGKSKRDN